LSHSPERFSKLRAIILDEFGTFESPKNITLNSLKACNYLQDCINESLRLYPPISLNARTAVRDTVLPYGGGLDGRSPVFISQGTKVQYSSFVTQRLKDIWGDDAEEWKPERWAEKIAGVDTGYMPFSGGPRVCIGRKSSHQNTGIRD
jgi:cytochrome P450